MRKSLQVLWGLLLFGFGNYCTMQANVGLAPWVAFTMGISQLSGMEYGNVSALIGIFLLCIDLGLKEKIGIGTILNTLLVGKFVDLFRQLAVLPVMNNLWLGILLLLCGQIVNSFGSYWYMSGGLGCGPRDSLMVALSRRTGPVPIGAVRSGIEATVLLLGWMMGAKIGIGTIISVVGIGFFIQKIFKLFHYNASSVVHDSLGDSLRKLRGIGKPV